MDPFSKRDRQSIISIALGVLISFILIIALILATYRGQLQQTNHVRDMGSLSENCAILAGTSQRIALLQFGLLGKRESTIENKLDTEIQRETKRYEESLSSLKSNLQASSLVSPDTVSTASQLFNVSNQFMEASAALSLGAKEHDTAILFADLTTQVISLTRETRRMISNDTLQSAAEEEARLVELHWLTLAVIILLGFFVVGFITFRLSQEFANRRSSEAELAKSNQELEHFSAIVAHDLRGPLNNLALCAQMLAEQELDLETVKQQLAPLISRQTNRLRDMITSLLELSRTGNTKIKLRRVKISEIVEPVKAGMKIQLENASATVKIRSNFKLRVDPALFQNVIQNLIENSIKYKVPTTNPEITISAEYTRSGWLNLVYEDNGLGISPALRERIFEPFFQSSNENEGLGLGLSLVKKILRLHNASISVEDKEGPGTRFVIQIPNKASWQFL